tara:strand:+ start:739 stop:1767 length:1029 start_codon:yes stop_codon:yes gene_type:complete
MDFSKILKTQWVDYLQHHRAYLSPASHKLYASQIVSISIDNNINEFEPLKFITRMVNKAVRDKSLSYILLDGSEQSQNQRLSAIRNILEINKESLDLKKYNRLADLISIVGDNLRASISKKVGTNIKTPQEENAMTVTWEQINEFAKNYTPEVDNINGFRNYLLLNLLVNNWIEKDGIKYYTLLRRIEYASLYVWSSRKKPPTNKRNYIYLYNNQLYIQHSKTTGGVRRVRDKIINQPMVKTYPISEEIKTILVKYIKTFKIKNDQPLFYGNKGLSQINSVYYSALLKELLEPLNKNLNSTLLRKIYENRPLEKSTNSNETDELMKLADHSLAIAAKYYKKI